MKAHAFPLLSMLMLSGVAFGQTRPKISQIVSAADFTSGVTYSEWTTVFGTGLSDAVYQAQGLPYPQKLGSTQVFLCYSAPVPSAQVADIVNFLGCVPTSLSYVSPSQINILTPASLPTPKLVGLDGNLIYIVSVGGVVDQDAAAQSSVKSSTYNFSSPQPRIFTEGTDCLIDLRFQNRSTTCGLTFNTLTGLRAIRGAVTDLKGNVISSSNPTRLGDWYTIWLTGMGAFTNGKASVPQTLVMSNIPVYGYPGDTWYPIDSVAAPSPQFPGLYQVNFQVPLSLAISDPNWFGYPPPFPCGDYNWEITLDLTQKSVPANLVQIPVVVKNGDVPCKQ